MKIINGIAVLLTGIGTASLYASDDKSYFYMFMLFIANLMFMIGDRIMEHITDKFKELEK